MKSLWTQQLDQNITNTLEMALFLCDYNLLLEETLY